MPKISSTDTTIHDAQYLIYELQNPEPEIPLVKLGNDYKEASINPAEIFRGATPPEVPPRVPVRGAYQEKLQQVKQEIIQMKSVSQSDPFNNVEPMRVPIIETYPE